MTKAHKFSASHEAAFPNVLKTQETMDPMIPGRAAAALPAKLARARPRACRCFFTHSLTPPLSGRLGAGDGTSGVLSPPVSASTSFEIAMPIAVRMLTIVIPCSRKSVRIRSASVLSSWRSRLMVTNSVDLGPESCRVHGEGLEPRLSLELDVGELTLKLFHSVSNLLLNVGVVRFRQFFKLPGQVVFDFGFPVVDI